MRAWPSVPWSGVSALSRTYRPLVLTLWLVTAAVLPRTWTGVVKVTPSLDTWMSKSRVLNDGSSPPAWACRTVKELIAIVEPRSTVRILGVALEHHLSLLPPETLPLNAFAGPSLALHGVDPVAGLFSARLGEPPLGLTVQVNEVLPVSPVVLVAVTVTEEVTAVVAVPVIRPVVEPMDRPAGKPLAVYVSALPFGSLAWICRLTDWPTVLLWSPGLVTVGAVGPPPPTS